MREHLQKEKTKGNFYRRKEVGRIQDSLLESHSPKARMKKEKEIGLHCDVSYLTLEVKKNQYNAQNLVDCSSLLP